MAVFLKNTTVYHPGRTAGHWVRRSLACNNLIVSTTNVLHDSPAEVQHLSEAIARKFSVSFVRHPAHWIRSLWLHETQYGWTMESFRPSDSFGTFDSFLEELIERYPNGCAQYYFSSFVDLVTVNLKTETVITTMWPTLAHFGEPLPAEPSPSPVLNGSSNDFVARSAVARRNVWQRYLQSERDFCERFQYFDLPEQYIGGDDRTKRPWFPCFQRQESDRLVSGQSQPVAEDANWAGDLDTGCQPDQTFLISGLPRRHWRGKEECWRSQIAFIEAIGQSLSHRVHNAEPCRFLELACGDGYFVFLAEHLGYKTSVGIDSLNRATRSRAMDCLLSRSDFRLAHPMSEATSADFDTVLVRHLVNDYPWPHLTLYQAGKWLAPGGTPIISVVTVSLGTEVALRLNVDPSILNIPPTCRSLPTEACLFAEINESGFAVRKRYAVFEQFCYSDHPLSQINPKVSPLTPWSIQTIVLGLERRVPAETDVTHFWFQGQPTPQLDLSETDIGGVTARILRQLFQENCELREINKNLSRAVHDRDLTLATERLAWESFRQELSARTSRLENANEALNLIQATLETWRKAEDECNPRNIPSLAVEY